MDLIDGYKAKQRLRVFDVMLNHWSLFAECNYERAVKLLTQYRIADQKRVDHALALLDKDLASDRGRTARAGIDSLLKMR